MKQLKVLWVEDNANTDLAYLTSPIYIDGTFDLDITTNASMGHHYLDTRRYDVIILDIRIPPGQDAHWLKKHQELSQRNHPNSNRLGLELLKTIFGKNGELPNLKIEQNLVADRYGVFTVEHREELAPELHQLELGHIKYQHKNAMMSHTALLDLIREISGGIRNRRN